MTTKADQDIAAGFAAGGQEVKIPEGIMKPQDVNHSEHPQRGTEQNQPMDATSQGIAAGDPAGSGLESQVRIPEGIMKPAQDGQRSHHLPTANTDTSSANIAGGRPLDADSDKVKIPEAIMKPRTSVAQLTSPLTAAVSRNVAGGDSLNAMGFNVHESETTIPEGIMKPKLAGANSAISQPDQGSQCTNSGAGNPNNICGDSASIAAGQLVDASGKIQAEGQAKVPEGIMKPSMSS